MNNFKNWLKKESRNFSFIIKNRYIIKERLNREYIYNKLENINKLKTRAFYLFLISFIFLIPSFLQFLETYDQKHWIYFSLLIPIISSVFLFVTLIEISDNKESLKKVVTGFKKGLFFSGKNKAVEKVIEKIKTDPKLKIELLEYGKYFNENKEYKSSKSEKNFYSHLFYAVFENERENEKNSLMKYIEMKLSNNHFQNKNKIINID